MVDKKKDSQPLDFIDQIKEFVVETITSLHKSGRHSFQLIPPITGGKKATQGQKEMDWDFDSKEHALE